MSWNEYLSGISHYDGGLPVTRKDGWSLTKIKSVKEGWDARTEAITPIRSEFEDAAGAMGYPIRMEGDQYAYAHTQKLWEWWCRATEAVKFRA